MSDRSDSHTSPYLRFAAMIATSTVVMYGLMYLNTYSVEHVYFSQTRVWMALYMGASMAIIMLAYMLGMYRNRAVNAAIFGGAAIGFGLSLWLLRSQETVEDLAWMRAMIPHHSIAILTSERAELSDPRVQKLAHEIVLAQNREISEMRWLIDEIERDGEVVAWPLGDSEAPASVGPLAEALAAPVTAALDLEPMGPDQIDRALTAPVACRFRRVLNAEPVLAVTAEGGAVARISGQLVPLDAASPPSLAGVTVTAEDMTVGVTPDPSGDGATLRLDLDTDPELSVGYGGFWTCEP